MLNLLEIIFLFGFIYTIFNTSFCRNITPARI